MACDNLTGTWTNELNSTMIIQHRYDGLLGGNFGSKVESSAGLAGKVFSEKSIKFEFLEKNRKS